MAKKLSGLFAGGQAPLEAPPSASGGEGDRLLSDEGRAQLEAAAKKAAAATAASVMVGARKSLDLAKRAGEQIKQRVDKAREPVVPQVLPAPIEGVPVARVETFRRLPKGKTIERTARVPRWPLALLVIGVLGATSAGAWYFTRPKAEPKAPVLMTPVPAASAPVVMPPPVQPLVAPPTITDPSPIPDTTAEVVPAPMPATSPVPDPVVATAPIAAPPVTPAPVAVKPAPRTVATPAIEGPRAKPAVQPVTQPDATEQQLEQIDAFEKQLGR